MPLTFEERKFYYNRCHSQQPLAPLDERNVDIDGQEAVKPRGDNWVDRLAEPIELSNAPEMLLFTGLPGSGKSTELNRLVARLEGQGFVVAFLVADEILDVMQPIQAPELLVGILQAADARVRSLEGGDPQKALSEGPFAAVWRWIRTAEVETRAQAQVGVEEGPVQVGLTFDLKTDPSLKKWLRERAYSRYQGFLERVRGAISELDKKVKSLGHQGLVLVVDSLEKLHGVTENWREVLESAEVLFSGDHLELPVHVIYTVPPSLTLRLSRPVVFLPMIKLYQRPSAQAPRLPWQPGFDVAFDLIRRRLDDQVLARLMGPDWQERRRRIVETSGGYPRELVRLLQALLTWKDWSEAGFERFLKQQAEPYKRLVARTSYPLLALVATQHRLEHDDENREEVSRLLSQSLVLRYCNDEEWFDVHPAVWEMEGVREAIGQLNDPH